jgi:hypothetical protein
VTKIAPARVSRLLTAAEFQPTTTEEPMPLIEELKITLKDLMPNLDDGVLLRETRPGGEVMQVSTRLAVALKEYANAHQVELGSVLIQLRDEIHQS